MSLIGSFVRFNQKCSKSLANRFPEFFREQPPDYRVELLSRILPAIENGSVRSVLEAGGIDRPLLKKGGVFTYAGLDIESKETCYEAYDEFIVQSIEAELKERYDSIISITLLEHVPDNRASIASIYRGLNPGGQTHHYVPSKWHPYSVGLRVLGPNLQKKLIAWLWPEATEIAGYPAYFDHCTVSAMKKLMLHQGFANVDVRPFYRANEYFAPFTPLFVMVTLFENLCQALSWNVFASGFVVSAEVNGDSVTEASDRRPPNQRKQTD